MRPRPTAGASSPRQRPVQRRRAWRGSSKQRTSAARAAQLHGRHSTHSTAWLGMTRRRPEQPGHLAQPDHPLVSLPPIGEGQHCRRPAARGRQRKLLAVLRPQPCAHKLQAALRGCSRGRRAAGAGMEAQLVACQQGPPVLPGPPCADAQPAHARGLHRCRARQGLQAELPRRESHHRNPFCKGLARAWACSCHAGKSALTRARARRSKSSSSAGSSTAVPARPLSPFRHHSARIRLLSEVLLPLEEGPREGYSVAECPVKASAGAGACTLRRAVLQASAKRARLVSVPALVLREFQQLKSVEWWAGAVTLAGMPVRQHRCSTQPSPSTHHLCCVGSLLLGRCASHETAAPCRGLCSP